MSQLWRQLFAPDRLWLPATLLVLAMVALANWVTPAAAPPRSMENPLVFANGESVPDGHWSVLCIDGVAYLEIASPRSQAVMPKVRENGLIARCDPPGWQ